MSRQGQNRIGFAVSGLLEWIGDGRRLSELPTDKRKLLRFCTRYGYVRETPLKSDFLLECTGRRP